MSITHATAECEAYLLEVDLFKNFELDSSFISAVNSSYHSNDWETFISEFGTHFITEVPTSSLRSSWAAGQSKK